MTKPLPPSPHATICESSARCVRKGYFEHGVGAAEEGRNVLLLLHLNDNSSADQALWGRGLFSLFLLRAARFRLLLRLLLWSIVVERIILSN